MDHQETIWIKKEETDVDPDEPGLVFLEDPLKVEMPALPTDSDPDPDQKLCMDNSETNCVKDQLGISLTTHCIKEEPGLDIEADETANTCVKDQLGISWTTHCIKEEPGLDIEADETANTVEDSAKCASITTRLIQNSGKSCGISFEETVMQGHVPNELEICAVESPSLTKFDTQRQDVEEEEEEEEEEELLATRMKCSWRENEFHTFSCNFCIQNFTSKYKLIKHVFFHIEGVQPPTYICKSCGEVFSSDIGLNKHLKMNEEDSSTHRNQKTDCIYKQENMSLECYEMFSVRGQTKKQYSSELNSRTVRVPGTQSLKCDICDKSFKQLKDLKYHVLIHTGIRPHKCDVCGRSFTYASNLKKHEFIHTGVRPHKCNVCGKSFKHLSNLKSHVLIHTGMKPHKCDVCGKAYRQLAHLRNHALIHTGIKQLCDICGKSFSRLSDLKLHEMRHNGIRRRKCDVCGKAFTDLHQLKMHASIHTGTQMSPHM